MNAEAVATYNSDMTCPGRDNFFQTMENLDTMQVVETMENIKAAHTRQNWKAAQKHMNMRALESLETAEYLQNLQCIMFPTSLLPYNHTKKRCFLLDQRINESK